MRAQSLLIAGKAIPLEPTEPVVKQGLIEAIYGLERHHVAALLNAETVGVAFQYAKEAPIFLGFQGMKLADAKPKLKGLMSTCGVD